MFYYYWLLTFDLFSLNMLWHVVGKYFIECICSFEETNVSVSLNIGLCRVHAHSIHVHVVNR